MTKFDVSNDKMLTNSKFNKKKKVITEEYIQSLLKKEVFDDEFDAI
jgi:hypothetical protein